MDPKKLRKLQALRAKQLAAMRALVEKAEGEDRDLTEAEQKTFDEQKANMASLDARITRLQDAILASADPADDDSDDSDDDSDEDEPPVVRRNVQRSMQAARVIAPRQRAPKVGIANGASQDNRENDTKRGFHNFGEFCQSVYRAGIPNGSFDERLNLSAAAPSTFGGEGVGADGGFAVPPAFSNTIDTLSLTDDALLPYTDNIPVQGNGMVFPKDETTPWGTDGVRAYWQAEGTAGTATKPKLGETIMRLYKLMALVPLSNELLEDSVALASYYTTKVADSLRWKINEAILFGLGNGTPQGCFTGAAGLQVSKTSGQATATLSAANIAQMISQLPPGSYGRSIWLINNDVLPALFTMTLGNYPIFLPIGTGVNGGIQQNPYAIGMLLGRPVIVSQHANTFSSVGDVLLLDLKYYRTITKARGEDGVTTDSSIHLYFDADATAFRTMFRVDGMSKIAATISPANGTVKMSPFLKLQAR